MAFVTSRVKVKVPATSANLGPGFDSLGLALSLYDTITARIISEEVRVTVLGEGADDLPLNERHLIAATMLTTFDLLGHRPSGFELVCENAIPQARGMGSSSAAIVAGIMLARHLVQDGDSHIGEPDIIRLAAELEGHPDNVAPCVLGGFTIAWQRPSLAESGGVQAIAIRETKGVTPIIFVPVQKGYTEHARAVLPPSVPLRDAAFNAARAALLVRALTGTPTLLFDATEDRIHQEYRAAAMPASMEFVTNLRAKGIAAAISGAGPSVLALVPDRQPLIAEALTQCPDGWWARSLLITNGASLEAV